MCGMTTPPSPCTGYATTRPADNPKTPKAPRPYQLGKADKDRRLEGRREKSAHLIAGWAKDISFREKREGVIWAHHAGGRERCIRTKGDVQGREATACLLASPITKRGEGSYSSVLLVPYGVWEGGGISANRGGVWKDAPTSIGREGIKWAPAGEWWPCPEEKCGGAKGCRGGGDTGKQVHVTIPSRGRVSEYSEAGPGIRGGDFGSEVHSFSCAPASDGGGGLVYYTTFYCGYQVSRTYRGRGARQSTNSASIFSF